MVLTSVNTAERFRHHSETMPKTPITSRRRADQDEILQAFVDRLREHPLLNTANVVVSDQAVPVPEAFSSGKFLISVSAGAGEYPHLMWSGGHHATATEDGSVIIGIYAQSVKDRYGRKDAALLKGKPSAPSLLEWKRTVLKQLTVSDEETVTDQKQAWEPSDDLQQALLRDQPQPVRSTAVLDVPNMEGWIGLQITFTCTWDWDLYRA